MPARDRPRVNVNSLLEAEPAARRVAPKSRFSAARASEAPWNQPVGGWRERNCTSTLPARPAVFRIPGVFGRGGSWRTDLKVCPYEEVCSYGRMPRVVGPRASAATISWAVGELDE